MKLKQPVIVLLILLVFVLLAKIIVLSGTTMPAYDSYFGMRQIEHIKQTGTPLLQDTLSYQGRTNTVDFLFYYLLAFVSLFIPMYLIFLYGGILISLASLIIIFLVTRKLYSNKWIAILVTTLAALSTVLFSNSLATITPSSFFLLVYLGMIYAFIRFAKNQKHLIIFLILAIVGTLLTSLMLVLVGGFILYFILLKLEKLSTRYREVEIVGFTGLFVIWYHLIVYRKLFQLQGTQSLWEGIPRDLLTIFFQKMSLPIIIALVGVIPFILGLYAIYNSLFTQRRRYLLLITALTINFLGLLFLGFIPILDGLLFVTINLIILSGFALKQLNEYFKKTNFSKLKYALIALLIIFAIINFIPSMISSMDIQSPNLQDQEFLQSQIFPEDATILGNIQEGHFISYTTQRKNFYDTKFTLAPRAQQRYEDAQTIFLSTSKTNTLSLLNYYNIDYIYLSELTRNTYNINFFLFEKDPCFKLIGETETSQLYMVQCTISK